MISEVGGESVTIALPWPLLLHRHVIYTKLSIVRLCLNKQIQVNTFILFPSSKNVLFGIMSLSDCLFAKSLEKLWADFGEFFSKYCQLNETQMIIFWQVIWVTIWIQELLKDLLSLYS